MMRKFSSLTKTFLVLTALSFLFIIGCKDSVVAPDTTEPTTDKEALMKIADEDSAISSFESNFNEESAMELFVNSETDIYPVKVGHRVRLVERNMNVVFEGDTAQGTLTQTFEGVLYIFASFSIDGITPDTLITKTFTSVVTRNIIFVKVGNSNRPMKNWRMGAVSLPKGGTLNSGIQINKLIVTMSNGETVEITDPNEFFFNRGFKWWRQFPIMHQRDSVKIDVELTSAYEAEDFVTLTFGADMHGMHRAKRLFNLVSSTPSGSGYVKVYSQTFYTHQFPGFYHAVINAMPRQVIFDSNTSVEHEMWGMPYFVNNN